jgi:protein-S-isoprenylcysteine O-methyltransferase Ste14
MSAGHLLLAIGMTAQILISIPYEERDIEDDLGEPYRDYKAKTPMLIPFAKIRD